MFGQPLAGTDKSPQLLREAGLHQNLAALGWRVEEMGDVVRHIFAGYPGHLLYRNQWLL